jgi:phosphatidylglycerol:prolipoprotein diacylglycerol transferase
MYQILFRVPYLDLKVYGFGLMLTLALLGAINLTAWRARKEKLNPDQVFDLSTWVLLGGLLGARIFFVVEYWKSFKHWWEIFYVWNGGIVLYGSILGATVVALLYQRRHPFPTRPMMDAIAPAIALGVALGRIGCFLNGCCYGDVCHLPWAVTFPAESLAWGNQVRHHLITTDALRSLPVHPTQLYSAIDGFLLLALLTAYYPIRKRDGEVMALLMMTYPVTRFFIERLRNDEAGFVQGLTISQAISVGLFIFGLIYWAYLSKLPRTRYADTAA